MNRPKWPVAHPPAPSVRNESRPGLVFRDGRFRFFRRKFVLSPFMSHSISAAEPRIQPATLKDIPTIMALAEATWEPTYRFIISKEQLEYMYRVIYTPASLKRQMQEQQHTFLVAYVEEHPAGYASFSPLPAPQVEATAPDTAVGPAFKMHKIYVMPSHQGQGLGVRLLEAVEQAVTAAGGQFLELNVNRHNASAISFYERHGYSRQREVDVPIGPYWMNDFIMRKQLAK
jgi:ribosomal protein S18 acetylase RimI-like enzyme